MLYSEVPRWQSQIGTLGDALFVVAVDVLVHGSCGANPVRWIEPAPDRQAVERGSVVESGGPSGVSKGTIAGAADRRFVSGSDGS
jgi:hypothetical protein